jgi:hypothetical protein
MKTSVLGSATTGSIVVVGTWDPLGPSQRQLLRDLVNEARARGLRSTVVMFDPAPAMHLHPVGSWLEYESFPARLERIRASGVDHVLCVRFSKTDLRRGVRELLDQIERHVRVQELWIGTKQSLGSGEAGNQSTIRAVTEARGIGLRILGRAQELMIGNPKRCLSEGKVAEARALVGFAPVWAQPKRGVVQLSWSPGQYIAAPVASPLESPGSARLEVELLRDPQGGVRMVWPDARAAWLSFLGGPGDASPDDVCLDALLETPRIPASEVWHASAD